MRQLAVPRPDRHQVYSPSLLVGSPVKADLLMSVYGSIRRPIAFGYEHSRDEEEEVRGQDESAEQSSTFTASAVGVDQSWQEWEVSMDKVLVGYDRTSVMF